MAIPFALEWSSEEWPSSWMRWNLWMPSCSFWVNTSRCAGASTAATPRSSFERVCAHEATRLKVCSRGAERQCRRKSPLWYEACRTGRQRLLSRIGQPPQCHADEPGRGWAGRTEDPKTATAPATCPGALISPLPIMVPEKKVQNGIMKWPQQMPT